MKLRYEFKYIPRNNILSYMINKQYCIQLYTIVYNKHIADYIINEL